MQISACLALPSWSAQAGYRFAGVEFYGSSQITRLELERYLGLRPGAPLTSIAKAVERLNRRLAERHVNSTVQVVSAPPDKVYVTVDVSDSSTDVSAPTRKLKYPRHVQVRSDKPFMLLEQIETRLEKLNSEGRPFSEELREGIKYYSDEPCNQLADQLVKQVPDMREEFLAMVDSDPDPNRRRRAVDVLNWAGATPDTCRRLIPALDDADPEVRASVGRWMFSRLDLLPDNFPFEALVEAFSRQINRPSHQDRTKALYCLLAICGQRPQMIANVKVFNEDRIKKLAQDSVIPTVKDPAAKLLTIFAREPALPQASQMYPPRPQSGF